MPAETDILMNFRDSPAIASEMEDLLLQGIFPTKSELIRTAIRELLDQHRETSNARKITVNIASKVYNRANFFIGKGYALNFETLFNDLLNEYINEMEKEMKAEIEIRQQIEMKKFELNRLADIQKSQFG